MKINVTIVQSKDRPKGLLNKSKPIMTPRTVLYGQEITTLLIFAMLQFSPSLARGVGSKTRAMTPKYPT